MLRGVVVWYGADGTPHNFYENFIDVMVNIDGSDGTAESPCVGVMVQLSAGGGRLTPGSGPTPNELAPQPDPQHEQREREDQEGQGITGFFQCIGGAFGQVVEQVAERLAQVRRATAGAGRQER
ncbi:hypothetical protein D3C84_939000 [compost metagenome]